MIVAANTLHSLRTCPPKTMEPKCHGYHNLQGAPPTLPHQAFQYPQQDFLLFSPYPTTTYQSTREHSPRNRSYGSSSHVMAHCNTVDDHISRRERRQSTTSGPAAGPLSQKSHASDLIVHQGPSTRVYRFSSSHPREPVRSSSPNPDTSPKSWRPRGGEPSLSSGTSLSRSKRSPARGESYSISAGVPSNRSPDRQSRNRRSSGSHTAKAIPPRAPEIPRLSTPEFDFAPEWPDHSFCTCCPGGEHHADKEQARWSRGAKMDTQRTRPFIYTMNPVC